MRILITGGSRGIGAACVRKFAAQGDSVAFLYRNSEAQAKMLAAETGAFAIRADVSDAEAVLAAVAEAERLLGGIDVLVNNAGVAQIKLFTDISAAEWRTMLDTNLSSAFFASQAAARGMISRKHVSSILARCGARLARPARCIIRPPRRVCVDLRWHLPRSLVPRALP